MGAKFTNRVLHGNGRMHRCPRSRLCTAGGTAPQWFMAKLLPHIFSNLDKLVSKLPKTLRDPVQDHVRSMEELFAHGQLDAARHSKRQAVKLEAADKPM